MGQPGYPNCQDKQENNQCLDKYKNEFRNLNSKGNLKFFPKKQINGKTVI
jgi:hypothetical protein